MHKYIDIEKVRVFDDWGKWAYNDVENDIVNVYGITNILEDDDDELLYFFCNQFYEDYVLQRANYKAYIEEGMNARMLAELRKSAIIRDQTKHPEFYSGHSICETWQDVKDFRTKFINNLMEDYVDLDWQYFFLVTINQSMLNPLDFIPDLECCFADRRTNKSVGLYEYWNDCAEAKKVSRAEYEKEHHIPELIERLGLTNFCKIVW